ncbi:hypothetical protein B0H15DRAFT_800914 [Mycena belliarum]|uniref:Uncharacterized protein n=1 Tax=Mycena belliarum TaxID=1033014 RepID=A0AAD6U8E0_9AGAR|nr:hypothetical protein B0H15DRAFT_800914 [Mycena belliae]
MSAAPTLPAPYADGPDASEEEQDAYAAAIDAFVTHLVLYNLSEETTAAELFKPFATPEHQPMLFAYACANILSATHELSDAAPHLPLLAALFALLKDEGLRRDGNDGMGMWGNTIVFPALRGLLSDVPAPPGHSYDPVSFALIPSSSAPDVALPALASYARSQSQYLRLWGLVSLLESSGALAPGSFTLLFHQAPALLRGLEDPLQRGTWESLWVAAGAGQDDDMDWGKWGKGDSGLGPFTGALKTIAQDKRAPLEWRARFALIWEELEQGE